MTDLVVLQRLVVVTVLAGAIGVEREQHGRAAGFRTHILVGVGACLVMLTGLHLWETMEGDAAIDPTRMAAQVVSGIGFLGAGTILRFRASVRGLTTAASLWAAAGIGLAVGAGFLVGAVASTVVVLTALFGFSRLERALRTSAYGTLVAEGRTSGEELANIRRVLAEYDVEIRDLDIQAGDGSRGSQVELRVKLPDRQHMEEIIDDLQHLKGITRVHWV
jgi:putative Mg2+ transporter-C (MgtC) family protein